MQTAAHWLIRAEDARTLADEMRDLEARRTMLAIAVGYEKLARHAASLSDIGLPLAGDDEPRG